MCALPGLKVIGLKSMVDFHERAKWKYLYCKHIFNITETVTNNLKYVKINGIMVEKNVV